MTEKEEIDFKQEPITLYIIQNMGKFTLLQW